jgi:hypothetical protein
MSYETQPSSTSENYSINDLTYSAGVTRVLSNGSITFDGEMTFSDYESVGSVRTPREDEDYYSLGLIYRREVLKGRGSFNSSFRWSQNTGDRDWERYQVALGFDFGF